MQAPLLTGDIKVSSRRNEPVQGNMETLIGDDSAHKATIIKVAFRSYFSQGDTIVFTSGTSSTAIPSKTTKKYQAACFPQMRSQEDKVLG